MPTTTQRLQLQQPVGPDSVSELRLAITQHASALDGAAIDLQDVLANRPPAALQGRYFWATDTQQLYRDTGTTWILLTGQTTTQSHSFTMDDQTGPNPAATVLGSFFVNPSAGETITLLGAIVHCVTVGSTPFTFAVQTDHAQHGTLQNVNGLTGLTPATVQQLVTITPMPLAALDRIAVTCTNPASGNSLGATIDVLTGHAG